MAMRPASTLLARLFPPPTATDELAEGKRAAPFFKWVGGKTRLLKQIESRLPVDTTGRYWEPFLGAGAVFFAVDHRFAGGAVLSDLNLDIVTVFEAVRDSPDEVIRLFTEHQYAHTKHHYKEMRASDPETLSRAERAARFLYLNKTCYNGVYRVNGSGRFNSPFSAGGHSPIVNSRPIRLAAAALQDTVVRLGDFTTARPHAGDVVYCDPPYDGAYDKYTPAGFGEEHQRRLAGMVREWADDGALVMVSNYDTALVRELYAGCYLSPVFSPRVVNRDPNGRAATKELIITTYEHPMWKSDRFQQLPLPRA